MLFNIMKVSLMGHHKFNPAKLKKLEDPRRLERERPDLIWPLMGHVEVLVDLGAGTGFFCRPFAENMGSGTIWACDQEQAMIDYMSDNLSKDGDCSIKPLLVEEVAIPLDDNVADCVFMANVFHELENPKASCQEAFRLLKHGGRLVVLDWRDEETADGPPVAHRLSEAFITASLESAGFKKITSHALLPQHHLLRAEKK